MRLFDRSTITEILFITAFGVIVLSVFLVGGNAEREIFDLVIARGVPLQSILAVVLLLLPFSLVYTIPWAFLVAILLAFGRMSASNELMALQASGVSIARIAAPVVAIAAVLSCACLALALEIVPRTHIQMLAKIEKIAAEHPFALLSPNGTLPHLPNRRVVLEPEGNNRFQNLLIVEIDEAGFANKAVLAKAGSFEIDHAAKSARLALDGLRVESGNPTDPGNPAHRHQEFSASKGIYELPLGSLLEVQRRSRGLSAKTLGQLLELARGGDTVHRTRSQWEIQSRLSTAAASVAFAVVGVPLGIVAHRRETSAGIGISLAMAFSYYIIQIVAKAFIGSLGSFAPILAWLPNLLFVFIGLILAWRMRMA